MVRTQILTLYDWLKIKLYGIVCSKSTEMLYRSILGYVLNGITLVAEIAKDSDKKKR